MSTNIQQNFRIRKDFTSIKKKLPIPGLIDIQKRSYNKFLQMGVLAKNRKNIGLHGVFKSVFPIKDKNGLIALEFINYYFDKPKYGIFECTLRGINYTAPLRLVVRLVIWDKKEDIENQMINDVKESEINFGEIPLMTRFGTFIINGTERVVVSQLQRSPGVFFYGEAENIELNKKEYYSARIIPYRGSWIDFDFDSKGFIYCRIDRKRKFFATTLLRAIGFSTEILLRYFYPTEVILLNHKNEYYKVLNYKILLKQRAVSDIFDPKTNGIIIKKDRKFTEYVIKRMEKLKIKRVKIDKKKIYGRIAAETVVNLKTKKVIIRANTTITNIILHKLKKIKKKSIRLLFIDKISTGSYFRDTLAQDKCKKNASAVLEVYGRLYPGDLPTLETAEKSVNSLFFNPEKYDLSEVGRLKLNYKFSVKEPLSNRILARQDILEVVRYLIRLKKGRGSVDDIDHLGNRRVRAVGELIEIRYRVGLVRMAKSIKEKFGLQDKKTATPQVFVNNTYVDSVIKEFFCSSQLSQFMDKTNPLSEITHKRRLSALGPGGLTRDRAGFEVRDVHATHYGRICPIETPEGQNIGLIASLSTYARVNGYGFVETPYKVVKNQRVTNEIIYYTALQETNLAIAQATTLIDKKSGKFVNNLIQVRKNGGITLCLPREVSLIDIASNQLASIGANLIPFLEHNDANRALMGSNMQRQAVPLIYSEAPLVGTGMERIVGVDSDVCKIAKQNGVVIHVDSYRVIVKSDKNYMKSKGGLSEIYSLKKFQRSNQNTCFNQHPIVKINDIVKIGDILADGIATDCGELALGKNLMVAFMPWHGYNFEDSILISERLLKDDVFTSIHIERYECIARLTQLGPEMITPEVPNVGDEAIRHLDETGIVRVGAIVGPGDILVGKTTPIGEIQQTPEEKLLRAIFGDKARGIKDTSLRAPLGSVSTIIEVKIYSKKEEKKNFTSKNKQKKEDTFIEFRKNELIILHSHCIEQIIILLKNKKIKKDYKKDGKVIIKKGEIIDNKLLKRISWRIYDKLEIEDVNILDKIKSIMNNMEHQTKMIKRKYREKIRQSREETDIPTGILEMVKVFIAIKRKLQSGDKMAGRHGNKGVISKILPEEDMPYSLDGTPVDIVLNPLGVPSRMNIGQILETHLGWAAYNLGKKLNNMLEEGCKTKYLKNRLKGIFENKDMSRFIDGLSKYSLTKLIHKFKKGIPMITPVFDGAPEYKIRELLDKAGVYTSGQSILFDGQTGRVFDQNITVGIMYMLKLNHLVDEKIHARSIGPYSLITQQPLGGKSKKGGQRLGEMEVWALEGYGAAYALQEFLTVKSDDVIGRTRMYESIVRGEHMLNVGIPESFNVLMKELQSLGLDIKLLNVASQKEYLNTIK